MRAYDGSVPKCTVLTTGQGVTSAKTWATETSGKIFGGHYSSNWGKKGGDLRGGREKGNK